VRLPLQDTIEPIVRTYPIDSIATVAKTTRRFLHVSVKLTPGRIQSSSRPAARVHRAVGRTGLLKSCTCRDII
jgi:hypothetical protein